MIFVSCENRICKEWWPSQSCSLSRIFYKDRLGSGETGISCPSMRAAPKRPFDGTSHEPALPEIISDSFYYKKSNQSNLWDKNTANYSYATPNELGNPH